MEQTFSVVRYNNAINCIPVRIDVAAYFLLALKADRLFILSIISDYLLVVGNDPCLDSRRTQRLCDEPITIDLLICQEFFDSLAHSVVSDHPDQQDLSSQTMDVMDDICCPAQKEVLTRDSYDRHRRLG